MRMTRNFFLFFVLLPFSFFGQLLQDTQAKHAITTGLDHLYSYEFKEASQQFSSLRNKYPKHPIGFLLAAMQLEQQYFPMKDHAAIGKQYVQLLEKSHSLSLHLYTKNEQDLEAAFFCAASLGFLAGYEADNQNFFKAVSYAKKAYSFMKIGLKNTENQAEFNYASGIYKYYRISYPEIHPIIKPLMWFFEDGNKKLGLSYLEAGTKKAVFVKNESLFYLGYIYNKYEGTPAKALPYSLELIKAHPNNYWYILQRAELLSLTGNFEGAEYFCAQLEKSKSAYFIGSAMTLRAMREEFENRNLNAAESLYLKSLSYPWEERFTKDIRGLSYLGLIRIAQKNGETTKARKYTQVAKEYLEYKNSLIEFSRITGQ